MTETEVKKLTFRIARFCNTVVRNVEIYQDKTEVLPDGNRKVYAKVQAHDIGCLLDGEYILSMWYVI